MNGPERADLSIRRADPGDAGMVAEIFNQGVEDRVATFETETAGPGDAERWITHDTVVVAERDGTLIAWARAGPYTEQRDYYAGVREATMYVARDARRTGVGHALLAALADEAAAEGAHKLVGKIFTSNEASIALVKGLGWREVGVHKRHGALDGEWKDVLVVEKLLEPVE